MNPNPDSIIEYAPREPNYRWGRKILRFFSTGREVSSSDALLPKKMSPSGTVVRVDDGKLVEEYALSSTTLVIVEVG